MSFISISAHKKFISQCYNLVIDNLENEHTGDSKANNEKLTEDLDKLQQLANEYLSNLSRLSDLTNEYYTLHRHIRINMRKAQILKTNK